MKIFNLFLILHIGIPWNPAFLQNWMVNYFETYWIRHWDSPKRWLSFGDLDLIFKQIYIFTTMEAENEGCDIDKLALTHPHL